MRVTPVAVAALLLLAGCNTAPSLKDTGTASVTPVDVPADYDYAPGVTVDGVTQPATLAAAHGSVIGERSYRLTTNRTVRYANGTLREQLLVDVRLAADGTHLASATIRGPAAPVFLGRPPANGTFWSNGTVYVRKLSRDGRTTYNEFETPGSGAATWQYWAHVVPFGGEQATPRGFYSALFAAVPVRIAGEASAGDATTYRLVGDTVADGQFVDEFSAVHDVRLVATVRADGLVASLSLRYTAEIDGETVRVVRTVRYRDVGATTVERPPWFEKAVGE